MAEEKKNPSVEFKPKAYIPNYAIHPPYNPYYQQYPYSYYQGAYAAYYQNYAYNGKDYYAPYKAEETQDKSFKPLKRTQERNLKYAIETYSFLLKINKEPLPLTPQDRYFIVKSNNEDNVHKVSH